MTNPTGPYGGGQAPQNPYGQNPYGQQPAPAPYGQPQQPPPGPPQQQPQGYGYPQPGPDPYGRQPQPQSPYGQPSAPPAQQPQQQPAGYPQPGPNPYAMPNSGQPQNPYGQLGVNTQAASEDDGFLKKTGLTKMRLAGLVALVVVAGGWKIYDHISAKSEPASAAVGDCIHMDNSSAVSDSQAARDAKKVSCTDPSANYTVVGRVEDSSSNTKCAAAGGGWKDGDPYVAQFSLSTKNKSWVLCLEPK